MVVGASPLEGLAGAASLESLDKWSKAWGTSIAASRRTSVEQGVMRQVKAISAACVGPYLVWPGAVLRAIGTATFTVLLCLATPAPAHESDQYSLPVGRDFANLGSYFSAIFEAAVEAAVADTNSEIDDALAAAQPGQLERLQSSDYIASQVWAQLFIAMPTNELLDATLQSEPVRALYPGLVTVHWAVPSIYDDPLLLLDISKFVRSLFRAATVDIDGTVLGTDKIVHFVNVGRIYHAKYEELRRQGLADEPAVAATIRATSANPFYSEDGFLGIFSTGIHSNADLAADLAGFKFYRNLSETVRIGTRQLGPMLQRDGPHWRVVMPAGSQRFAAFVTPHWNEVLNPNRYLDYVAWRVRVTARERCADVLEAYRDSRGRRMNRAMFQALAGELSTYFGAAYDHATNAQDPVSVSELCFAPADDSRADAGDDDSGADALGRTPLWWAARAGQVQAVQQGLARGIDPDLPDIDGETALHAAARADQLEVVEVLLRHGAKPNAAALYGVTPLLLAAAQDNVPLVLVLLAAGADPNRAGPFGRTALHEAASSGHRQLAELLLRHGADPLAVDELGNSTLRLAQRHGDSALLSMLRQHVARASGWPTPAALTASPTGAGAVLATAGVELPGPVAPAAGAAENTLLEPVRAR